jgi:predicted Zn-ribbon and HTH transcriptional regulator
MKKKSAEPPIPRERRETLRREIITLLKEETLSAREISAGVGASEKEVYDHLAHIQKSREQILQITPAECRKCGFLFRKRERLRKPGRCPVCRGESIKDPFFSLGK